MVYTMSARLFGRRLVLERCDVFSRTQVFVGRLHPFSSMSRRPLASLATTCCNNTVNLQRSSQVMGHSIHHRISCSQPNQFIRHASGAGQDVSGQSSPEGRLVYQGPATSIVKVVKFFSLSTSVITLSILPWFVRESGDHFMKVFGGALSAVVFITPVLLHTISRSYVTKMYFNPLTDTYTAVTFTLFLRRRLTQFTAKDVEVPGVTNLLTTFKAKGKSFLVDPIAFPNPDDYNHLMGYDKYDKINLDDIIKKANADGSSKDI